jgi:hypothetical protein
VFTSKVSSPTDGRYERRAVRGFPVRIRPEMESPVLAIVQNGNKPHMLFAPLGGLRLKVPRLWSLPAGAS